MTMQYGGASVQRQVHTKNNASGRSTANVCLNLQQSPSTAMVHCGGASAQKQVRTKNNASGRQITSACLNLLSTATMHYGGPCVCTKTSPYQVQCVWRNSKCVSITVNPTPAPLPDNCDDAQWQSGAPARSMCTKTSPYQEQCVWRNGQCVSSEQTDTPASSNEEFNFNSLGYNHLGYDSGEYGPITERYGWQTLCQSEPVNVCKIYSTSYEWSTLIDETPTTTSTTTPIVDYFSRDGLEQPCDARAVCASAWEDQFDKHTNRRPTASAITTTETTVADVAACAQSCLEGGVGRCASFDFVHSDSSEFNLGQCRQYAIRYDAASDAETMTTEGQDYYVMVDVDCVAAPVVAPSWLRFKEAHEQGTDEDRANELPDYSFAGYRRGEHAVPEVNGTIFRVDDYGGIPDDEYSDQVAIQNTIAAAEANGGGIVLFNAGKYLIHMEEDAAVNNTQIRITTSNIVLRGVGSRVGGTIIQQALPTRSPIKAHWKSPFMIVAYPSVVDETHDPSVVDGKVVIDGSYYPGTTLAHPVAATVAESFWLTVNDATAFSVDLVVRLVLITKDIDLINKHLSPHSVTDLRPENKIHTRGLNLSETHTVAEVDGNRVRFYEPIHVSIDVDDDWEVHSVVYDLLDHVGVEDINFMGAFAPPQFFHNRNDVYSGGWSTLGLYYVTNSWIRRCSFINTVRPIRVVNSQFVSVYEITVDGNQGHFPFQSMASSHIWVGLFEDKAKFVHGLSTQHETTGLVYWRCDWRQDHDIHGLHPRVSLFDAIHGGGFFGFAGHYANHPHHLQGLTIWNHLHRSDVTNSHHSNPAKFAIDGLNYPFYDLWEKESGTRIVNATVVGMHGDPSGWYEPHLKVLESLGSKVEPESLFEAQLALRLGGNVSEFYTQLRSHWEVLRQKALPIYIPPPRTDEFAW